MFDNELDYTHYDNPEFWLRRLRQDDDLNTFCGCYEGDLMNMWSEPVSIEEAHYSIKSPAGHTDHYKMGPGQQSLVNFIRELLDEARGTPRSSTQSPFTRR